MSRSTYSTSSFGDVNPKQEEYLDDILASANHLLALINLDESLREREAETRSFSLLDRERFLEAGFDHYLAKPVDVAALVSTVERYYR